MTTDGVGVSVKARIPAIEVSIPLIAKSVEKKETHAYRLRGGRPRMATRSKIVTRHKKGNSRTNGERLNLAHQGMGGGNLADGPRGSSAF
jgi:hypothetical protein